MVTVSTSALRWTASLPWTVGAITLLGLAGACGDIGEVSTDFQTASAQNGPSFGSAGGYAILGGTAVTCADSSVSGGVGVLSGDITQTNCAVDGTVVEAGGNGAAFNDFLAAYEALADEPCDEVLTGTLAGIVLTPGTYCF